MSLCDQQYEVNLFLPTNGVGWGGRWETGTPVKRSSHDGGMGVGTLKARNNCIINNLFIIIYHGVMIKIFKKKTIKFLPDLWGSEDPILGLWVQLETGGWKGL